MLNLPESRPAPDAEEFSWHWFHSERASTAPIAQWAHGKWYVVAEVEGITPREMRVRGWEYLGPCNHRPYSKYLDYWSCHDSGR